MHNGSTVKEVFFLLVDPSHSPLADSIDSISNFIVGHEFLEGFLRIALA